MAKIFISYRRSDNAAGYARMLANELRRYYGDDEVFRDIKGIGAGTEFRKVIQSNLDKCNVLIAVIGQGWLTDAGRDGQPRLQNPNDVLRTEIATALSRDIPVIPVLVANAEMPTAGDLPEDLKRLREFQYQELSDKYFERDVEELVNQMAALPGLRPQTWANTADKKTPTNGAGQKLWPRISGAAALAIALVLGGYYWFEEYDGDFFDFSDYDMVEEVYGPVMADSDSTHVISLTGNWTDANGLRYVFTENGGVVFVEQYHPGNSTAILQGRGSFDGQNLSVNFQSQIGGQGMAQFTLSPDGRTLTGVTTGAGGGVWPAQITRMD